MIQSTSKYYSVKVDGQDAASWADILSRFDDANIYQTWAYGSVRWGSQNLSHLVLYDDGNPVAAAQVRIAKVPVIPMGIAYIRWGPMWLPQGGTHAPSLAAAMLAELNREYVERRGYSLQIIPNSFASTGLSGDLESALPKVGFTAADGYKCYRTIVVDLSRTPEEIRKQLDKKWRNQLNGAEKNALTIEIEESLSAYDEFLRLYDGMIARKQFDTSVDVHEFRQIQETLPSTQKMKIFLAKKDGAVVASLVCSLLGNGAIYLLGATDERARELKAAYFLHWQSMLWMKSQGIKSYDLGGIDPVANPGGHHFKAGFGGVDVTQLALHSKEHGLLSRLASILTRRLRRG